MVYIFFSSAWYYIAKAGYPFSWISAPDRPAKLVQPPSNCSRILFQWWSPALALRCFSGNGCYFIGGDFMTKKVHFIGIGGSGISAIARMLLEKGWQVSGCDIHPSPISMRSAP